MPLDKMNGFPFDSLVSSQSYLMWWHEMWISITILWALHFDRSGFGDFSSICCCCCCCYLKVFIFILFDFYQPQTNCSPTRLSIACYDDLCAYFFAARIFIIIIHILLILRFNIQNRFIKCIFTPQIFV